DRDRDLVRHLFSSLQAACWRRAGVRTDGGNGYTRGVYLSAPMSGCTPAIASIAYRYFQSGIVLRTDGSEPNRTQSTDHNHAQFTANGFCRALSAKPSGSSRLLYCSPLLPTGCPPNLAGNRVGQRRSAISHSCRRGGAGWAKRIEQIT